MKYTKTLSLLSTALLLSGNIFAETLEISKTAMDEYKPDAIWVKATMVMEDGNKHDTVIQLQDNVDLNNLANGNLVYVKDHKEVFEVTNVSTDSQGLKKVELKTTNLIIGEHTKTNAATSPANSNDTLPAAKTSTPSTINGSSSTNDINGTNAPTTPETTTGTTY